MCYDPLRRRFVRHGGDAYPNQGPGGTWDYRDDGGWKLRLPKPNRAQYSLVWDGRACVAVGGGRRVNSRLSGAADDVEELRLLRPASASSFGKNCGTRAAPRLTSGLLPWIGQAAGVEMTGVAGPWLLLTGVSRNTWGSLSLPIDLSGARMPGCSLWIRPDFVAVAPSTGSVLQYRLPQDPSLVGIAYYHQGAQYQPNANAAGLVWSGALALRIGQP